VLSLQGVSKLLGKKELFRDVSFHLQGGERSGLIGPNGAGKTTLFHIILGLIEPDTGAVTRPKWLRLGYLPQEWVPPGDKTVLASVMDVHRDRQTVETELQSLQEALNREQDAERSRALALRQSHLLERLEHLGGYDLEARACRVLAGLGFGPALLDRPAATLSGGWAMRLELARLLLSEPDLLLLDEPTNHLDLDSLLWLENYLLATASAVILVSHDRTFLDRVVTRILELEQGQLQEYPGTYAEYLTEKALRRQIQLASFKNQQDRIRQIERFIERNRVRKDRARQAQSRMKQLEKIERLEAPVEEANIHFVFPEPPRSGRRPMELRGVCKVYGDQAVYHGIDLVIERGDRIAFLGPNGAGKSTLLKILAGVETVSGGELVTSPLTVPGYYAQYQWELLRPAWTVLEEASSVAGEMTQTQLRGLLGAFLFRGEDVQKKVSVLSGGEKARLILCKLLLQRPNLLLLDEPTNHLDIPSREVLETALDEYPGTLCFISHDRHFINRIATKILVVDSGRIHLFPGNYTDYQEIWRKRLEPQPPEADTGGADELATDALPARRNQSLKRLEAERRNQLFRLKKPIQERLAELENELDLTHELIASLTERLADPATYQQGSTVQDLQKRYQQARQQVQHLTLRWEDQASHLEELERMADDGNRKSDFE